MELDPTATRSVIDRLERTRGRLARLIASMEEGVDCDSLVAEVAAVDKEIAGAGYSMVVLGLHQRIVAGPDAGDDEGLRRLERLFLGLA